MYVFGIRFEVFGHSMWMFAISYIFCFRSFILLLLLWLSKWKRKTKPKFQETIGRNKIEFNNFSSSSVENYNFVYTPIYKYVYNNNWNNRNHSKYIRRYTDSVCPIEPFMHLYHFVSVCMCVLQYLCVVNFFSIITCYWYFHIISFSVLGLILRNVYHFFSISNHMVVSIGPYFPPESRPKLKSPARILIKSGGDRVEIGRAVG